MLPKNRLPGCGFACLRAHPLLPLERSGRHADPAKPVRSSARRPVPEHTEGRRTGGESQLGGVAGRFRRGPARWGSVGAFSRAFSLFSSTLVEGLGAFGPHPLHPVPGVPRWPALLGPSLWQGGNLTRGGRGGCDAIELPGRFRLGVWDGCLAPAPRRLPGRATSVDAWTWCFAGAVGLPGRRVRGAVGRAWGHPACRN